ncbi:MAG TPA: VOC family protein [Cyclobacteriaceae bacterium]|nr:VOC family protein [Cyclobacteriaceae bacterium]
MRIVLTSVMVDDQDKALDFYTRVLGFVKKTDMPVGEHKFLTVVSKEEQDGVELLLEPMGIQAAKVFQKALYDQGIPIASFGVDNVQQEYDRLSKLGVEFIMKPTKMGVTTMAVFKDTCGNNVQIASV